MNKYRPQKISGFTLAELIVSIAIISILIVVFIVSFTSFVSKAYLSNDLTHAKSMTNVLRNHLVLNQYEHLDGHDVKSILSSQNEKELSFSPKSKHHVFVYLYERQEIILINTLEKEKLINRNVTSLLNFQTVYGLTPEEIFGKNKYILTTKNSTLTKLIYDIGTVVNNINIYDNYEILKTQYLNKKSQTPILIEQLLNYFNPKHTLYVNTLCFKTLAQPNDKIEHIVLSHTLTNIPPLDIYYDLSHIKHLHIPMHIKTIETNALTKLNEETIVTISNHNIKIEENAFQTKTSSKYQKLIVEDFSSTPGLIVYDQGYENEILFNQTNLRVIGQIIIKLDQLPIYHQMMQHHIIIANDITIKIYTNNGYEGIIVHQLGESI